ncbi:15896_t:CDS:2, partial [Racocetra persica]
NVVEIPFSIKEYEKNKKPSRKKHIFSLYVDYMDGNKNRPVIVIHHIRGEKAKLISRNKVKIKLGWIIFGPPTDFSFSIKYPLVFKSGKYPAFREKDYHVINNHGMFGTCVLEATNITPQAENSSDAVTIDKIKYNPKDSSFVIGNYITRRQESVYQDYFVYDINDEKEVTDETVLKRLALYSWS